MSGPPPDPWQTEILDLDAYLARIGVPRRPPGAEALAELHEAHVRTFSFDNVDVLLDSHAGVGLAEVQRKFVGRGRGGYCFEHATLFGAALARLGYPVTRRLGRVGEPGRTGRTHCVLEVQVDGGPVLADPGFGLSLLRPIRLRDSARTDYRGYRYSVRRVHAPETGPGWQLSRFHEGAWELMHTTDDLPVNPIDLVMGHHFTSTFPSSHFRHGLMFCRHLPDQHVTVTHDHVTVRQPGRPSAQRPLRDGELPDLLAGLDAGLSPDELATLGDVVARLRRETAAAGSRP